MPAEIHILPSENIDREKWDNCVAQSSNGLIYSTSVYLDTMCDNWHGLVVNDYSAVMALPWRKKFGITYLYQPSFIQQSGLVGEVTTDIFAALENFSRYGDLFFNYSNGWMNELVHLEPKTNFIIDLFNGYEAIVNRYTGDVKANLKKANKAGLLYLEENDIAVASGVYQQSYAGRMPHTNERDYCNFTRLCKILQPPGRCFARKVVDQKNNIASIALLLKDNKRIYNIMNTTTAAGRQMEANYLLFDRIFHEFGGYNLLFDFEGSDLPGIKSFYEKFGGKNQPYYYYHFNKLPLLLRLLKR